MASKKKEFEGISLLAVYNDEDMDDIENEEDGDDTEEDLKNSDREVNYENTPPFLDVNSTPKTTPQQAQIPSSSPLPQPMLLDSQKPGRGRLTIVDYGHDESAMSPEAEEGEIVSIGRVMFGLELQTANGDFQEKMSPGTTSIQATPPQSSEQLDPSQSDLITHAVTEAEAAEADEDVKMTVEALKDVDPLDKFLPPPTKAKCSDELQEKINKFLSYKRHGKSFNAEVRNRKDYRNPDFLLHAVRYQDIDQIGSCFSKDVFDPHGYDKSDYYDEIEADMKREMERKEQERKSSQKVEFVAGGAQTGIVAAAPKINIPLPGVSTAADAVTRDGRQNKKSKWDKVDGDRRNPLPSGGQDSMSSVGAHAALLSAANAGAGYSAFALQRRREAEEKRSSERKLERRS